MKIVQMIKPINEDKRREIERELEAEKKRFKDASERAAEAVRQDMNIARWASKNTLELSMVILIGGMALARFVQDRKNERHKKNPPPAKAPREKIQRIHADAVGLSPEDFTRSQEGTLLRPRTSPDYP